MTCRPNTKSFEKPSTLFDRPTHEQVFEARYRSKNHKFQQPVRLITPWRIAAVIAVKYYVTGAPVRASCDCADLATYIKRSLGHNLSHVSPPLFERSKSRPTTCLAGSMKRADRREPLVFSPLRTKPFQDFTNAKRLLDHLSGMTGWRLHDLRRTCRVGQAGAGRHRGFVSAHRVLKPGGLFTSTEYSVGPGGDIIFPLPRAYDSSINFPRF
jgi:hypothetical protein